MLGRCANCNSAEVSAGLDGYTCSICGAYTIDGVAKRVTNEVVSSDVPHENAASDVPSPKKGLTTTKSFST